jgi:hypothetical protein
LKGQKISPDASVLLANAYESRACIGMMRQQYKAALDDCMEAAKLEPGGIPHIMLLDHIHSSVWWKAKYSQALAEEAMQRYAAAQVSLRAAMLLIDEGSRNESLVRNFDPATMASIRTDQGSHTACRDRKVVPG